MFTYVCQCVSMTQSQMETPRGVMAVYCGFTLAAYVYIQEGRRTCGRKVEREM